jgi:hypothetical protein
VERESAQRKSNSFAHERHEKHEKNKEHLVELELMASLRAFVFFVDNFSH